GVALLPLEDRAVRERLAVAHEREAASCFGDLVEVALDDQHVVRRGLGARDDLAVRRSRHERIAHVVEVPLPPGLVDADDEDAVFVGAGAQYEFPGARVPDAPDAHEVRGCEDDLRAAHREDAVPLGEVALITDLHADPCEAEVEHRVSEVARREVELLEYQGAAVLEREGAGDVDLAVAADEPAGRVGDGAGVEQLDPVALGERDDGRHAELSRAARHGPEVLVVDGLEVLLITALVPDAEVGREAELREGHDLRALLRSSLEEADHALGVLALRARGTELRGGDADDAAHGGSIA